MVLRQPDQEHELISELEHLRQRGVNPSRVVRLCAPKATGPSRKRLRSTLAVAFGFYCLLHGLPFLGAGFLPRNQPHEASSSRFSAKETSKLRRVVRQTFSSPEQFRRFLLLVGGGLTTFGAGLYFWGLSTPKQLNAQKTLKTDATTIPLDRASSPSGSN